MAVGSPWWEHDRGEQVWAHPPQALGHRPVGGEVRACRGQGRASSGPAPPPGPSAAMLHRGAEEAHAPPPADREVSGLKRFLDLNVLHQGRVTGPWTHMWVPVSQAAARRTG